MDNKLYSSAEAARLLGISDGTVRSWLSRFPETFKNNIHIVQQDGKKLWTEAGLELLRQRAVENAAKDIANNDALATESAMNDVANNDALALNLATESIAKTDAISDSNAMPSNEKNAIPSDETASFNSALVEGFVDKLSLEIAATIAEQIPSRVLHHIRRMLHHKPTQQEAQILDHATQQQLQLLPGIEKKFLALPQSK